MIGLVKRIKSSLEGKQFDLGSEKRLQGEILAVFIDNGIEVEPEYMLTPSDIPDFFAKGLVIEVKIKGNATAIYRQCKRYLLNEDVTGLLLVTNRSIGFPEEINGKPCFVFGLGEAWL